MTLFLHKPQNTDLPPTEFNAKQIKNYFYGNVLKNNREKHKKFPDGRAGHFLGKLSSPKTSRPSENTDEQTS